MPVKLILEHGTTWRAHWATRSNRRRRHLENCGHEIWWHDLVVVRRLYFIAYGMAEAQVHGVYIAVPERRTRGSS